MIQTMTKIYRKQTVEGVAIPAFIENGGYFFTDLDVYENGRVYCWNFEDWEHFKNDVARGWVVTSIPDMKSVKIHHLGGWKINNGNWLFDPNSFVEYVEKIIREMNPEWKNIYQFVEKRLPSGVRIGENGTGTAFKPNSENDLLKEDGKRFNLFMKENEIFHLVSVSVFADNTLQINRLENPISLAMTEFEDLIEKKVILSQIPSNAQVSIYGLGSFTTVSCDFCNDIKDILAEIKESVQKMNGVPTDFELCQKAFDDFNENPTEKNRQKLKKAYERVPEHIRMYLGDMDTKDIEYRMIIYGEDEIQNWSHYQLAKKMGTELPKITIPKIKK